MTYEDVMKKNAAVAAAGLVQPGMVLGLGTGSTVYWLIEELGRLKLTLKAVPTSKATAELATKAGIDLVDLNDTDAVDLTIDGADEIDREGHMIKGGGGALLQEKIVAAASRKLVIIADQSKLVNLLGRYSLPVEVIPFGHNQVVRRIRETGLCKRISLRKWRENPYETDLGHYILDCAFEQIKDPVWLEHFLQSIPGVVETGLFLGMADMALIGEEGGGVKTFHFHRRKNDDAETSLH